MEDFKEDIINKILDHPEWQEITIKEIKKKVRKARKEDAERIMMARAESASDRLSRKRKLRDIAVDVASADVSDEEKELAEMFGVSVQN